MICDKCGMQLPEDSLFCQYCGTPFSLETEEKATQDMGIPTQSNMADNYCYCERCGNVVNPKTKKCSKCGKSCIKFSGKIFTYVCIVLVIALLIGGGYLYKQNQELKAANQTLNKTVDIYKGRWEDALASTAKWKDKYSGISDEYSFYHEHAAIVSRGVTNYHSYGCPRLDYNYCWIYNIEAAAGKNYDPCPTCQ